MTKLSPEAAAIEDADGTPDPLPPVRGTVRRLFGWIIPVNLSIFVIWGSVPGVLLVFQLEGWFSLHDPRVVLYTGIVTTIGAFAALIAQPIASMVSDRTRSKFGRRAPWMVGGALVGGLGLVGMSTANGLVFLCIAWCIVQVGYNFAQGPLSAIMPDRIPRAVRGTFAALSGLGLMLGAIGGQALGASFSKNIPAGYIALAGFALIMITLFVVFNPDHSSVDLKREPFSLKIFLNTFWVNPVAHPDFFWAFLGRILLYSGYFVATGSTLLLLQNYIGMGHKAAAVVAIPGLATLVGVLPGILVSGPLSDKFGRRKLFVFIAAILIAVGVIVPLLSPTFTGLVVCFFIAGLGFGAFQSVDTAIMSEVLPSAASFGKDLGVVNIAATVPQVLAPGAAAGIILLLGYGALFPIGAVLVVLGAFAIWPVKAVR